MKKKSLIIVLIAFVIIMPLILACCAPPTVTETEIASFIDEKGINYSVVRVSDKKNDTEKVFAKVVAYSGKEESGTLPTLEIKIPAKITVNETEYAVTTIGSLAFNQKKISYIIVPEGVSKIESFAFGYCGATEIQLPSSITEIGEYAFVNCNNLREVILRAKVPPKLGSYVFKFYSEKDNVYEVNRILKITVPKDALETYKNVGSNSAWHEYVGIIK